MCLVRVHKWQLLQKESSYQSDGTNALSNQRVCVLLRILVVGFIWDSVASKVEGIKNDPHLLPKTEGQLTSWGCLAYSCLNSRGPFAWKMRQGGDEEVNCQSEEPALEEKSHSACYLLTRVTQGTHIPTHKESQPEAAMSTYRVAPKLAVCTQDFAFLETADSVWRQARDAAKHFTMHRLTLHENYADPQINGAEVKKPACKTVR